MTSSQELQKMIQNERWTDLAEMIRNADEETAFGLVEDLAAASRQHAIKDITMTLTEFEETEAVEILKVNY